MENEIKKVVLVADDDEGVRSFVSKCLDQCHTVIQAQDGAEAWAKIQNRNPDLLILDVMMPKMDGYTLCSKVKTDPATKSIPIVMLTGLEYELNAKLSVILGADHYLVKPFTPGELLKAVSRTLSETKSERVDDDLP